MSARVKGTQTKVEADYLPIDLRSENEIERDRRSKIDNYITAEKNFYITPLEAAEEIRWTLGINAKIPAELLPLLVKKHESDLNEENTPPEGGE
ncbi:hypothetical protein [Paenibacillus polymyxa]|uniref:hypothetical protein n=1 Tax=Paenibacillus polymyxa TaxID=1406 RepID=UPI001E59494C|nr:hypothetical protein [Paenibacillus polymyxa]